MQGLMMDQPLLISGLIQHAERHHGATEIVSKTVEGGIHRYTYRDAHQRARRLANALKKLGVGMHDRVATLAWNGFRHYEIYYAVAGSGAIIHTINPRLFPEQIAYIANHAEDKVVFYDTTFAPLIEKLRPQLKSVKHFIPLDASYEKLLEDDDFEWPTFDEKTAACLCYTSGTTGNPKGALYSHRSTMIHAYAAALPDTLNLSAREVGAAGSADVPRQRVEPAVLVHHGRREDGLPRPAPRRQEPLRAVRDRRRDDERRRADGVAGTARVPQAEQPALSPR
jgi:fatty-acyl-CoA synthase